MQVRRRGSEAWEPLRPGEPVFEGDWVRTGQLSFARVVFRSGVRLDFDEESMVEIRPPAQSAVVSGGGSAARASIALKGGTVRGSLDTEGLELAPLVGGSAAALEVQREDGSRFTVAADDASDLSVRLTAGQGGSRVQVESGAARVEVNGEQSPVKAGALVEVSSANRVERVEPLELPLGLEPGIDARFLYRPGMEIALSWGKVQGARDYRVQIARDLTFQKLVQSKEVGGTRYAFAPSSGGLYAWRVVARDEDRREGAIGPPRRLYVEAQRPKDLLLSPEANAAYEYVDEPPKITFTWGSEEGARRYRWVLAEGPDLLRQQVKSEVLAGQTVELSGFKEVGELYWGVYAEREGPEPIFLKPRKLVLKRVKKARFETVKKIDAWGQ